MSMSTFICIAGGAVVDLSISSGLRISCPVPGARGLVCSKCPVPGARGLVCPRISMSQIKMQAKYLYWYSVEIEILPSCWYGISTVSKLKFLKKTTLWWHDNPSDPKEVIDNTIPETKRSGGSGLTSINSWSIIEIQAAAASSSIIRPPAFFSTKTLWAEWSSDIHISDGLSGWPVDSCHWRDCGCDSQNLEILLHSTVEFEDISDSCCKNLLDLDKSAQHTTLSHPTFPIGCEFNSSTREEGKGTPCPQCKLDLGKVPSIHGCWVWVHFSQQ